MKDTMKKLLACIIIMTMVVPLIPSWSSKAEAAFAWTTENFDYEPKTKLKDTTADKGWSTGWRKYFDLENDIEDADKYEIETKGKFSKKDRIEMSRGLVTPIDLGKEQEYYLGWKLRWDKPVNLNGATRTKIMLDKDNFFGVSTDPITFKHHFFGRVQEQTKTSEKEFDYEKTYTFTVKIVADPTGESQVYMKVFEEGELPIEPQNKSDWTLHWTTNSDAVFSMLSVEANIYKEKGTITLEDIALGTTWDSIQVEKPFGVREDFDYEEGFLLINTIIDRGWSSGWKYSSDLSNANNDALDLKVSNRATIEGKGKFEIYRGLLKPIDMSKDKDYYLRFKFSANKGHENAGFVRFVLDNTEEHFFGVVNRGKEVGKYFVAKFGGERAYYGGFVQEKDYTIIVKIEAKESEPDRILMNIYGDDEQISDYPTDWHIELNSNIDSNKVFDVVGFSTDLNQKSSEVTLDHLYLANSWEEIRESREYRMQERFDYGDEKPLSTTIAENGWTSGWKGNADLSEPLDASLTANLKKIVTLDAGSSMYRGIMPMKLDTSKKYYISWKMGIETEEGSAAGGQAALYLSKENYIGFMKATDGSDSWKLVSKLDGIVTEHATVTNPAGEMYTILAKLERQTNGQTQVAVKLYEPGHSIGKELNNSEWGVSATVAPASVFKGIGWENNLTVGSKLNVSQLAIGSKWEHINQSEARKVGEDFFTRIDFTTAGLQAVQALYEAEDYEAALATYQTFLLNRLAENGFKLGEIRKGFGMNGTVAKVMDNKLVFYVPPDSTHEHIINEPGKIDWYVVSAEDPNYAGTLSEMDFTNLLSEAYIKNTNQTEYLIRWNEYWDDFTRNNNKQWVKAKSTINDNNYLNNNDRWKSRLHLANRSDTYLQQLGLLAQKNADAVDQILDPITTAMTLRLIVDKHLDSLVTEQKKEGGAPNQVLQAAVSLLRASMALDSFKGSSSWRASSDMTLGRYIFDEDSIMMQDGSDLEQSFNYNGTLIELGGQLQHLYGVLQEDFDASFRAERLRFMASLIRPMGRMPALSKMDNRPFFKRIDEWQKELSAPDPTVASILDNVYWDQAEYLEPTEAERPKDEPTIKEPSRATPLPAFNSIYYPYGGYTVMRSGWDRDDYHLFMKSSRRGSGHMDESVNQIQLTAFGKTMLIDSGSDSYSPEAEEKKKNEYLISSFAHNTMTVNDYSQLSYKTPGVTKGYTDPIDARWLTSEQFDFTEGLYDRGYGIDYDSTKPELTNIEHARQVVYVKELGAFIVTDRMFNKNSTANTTSDDTTEKDYKYTQVWNFAPSYEDDDVVTLTDHIYTKSSQGPNIELHHFSQAHQNNSVSYEKYRDEPVTVHGKSRYRGIYRDGTKAQTRGKTDVHVNWQVKGEGDQLLVTLINPFNSDSMDDRVQIEQMDNDENSNYDGFIARKGNHIMTYYAARDKQASFEVNDMIVTGEALLILEDEETGKVSGVVLGLDEVSTVEPIADEQEQEEQGMEEESDEQQGSEENEELNEQEEQVIQVVEEDPTEVSTLKGSFEFSCDQLDISCFASFSNKIEVPVSFNWVDAGDGRLQPYYGKLEVEEEIPPPTSIPWIAPIIPPTSGEQTLRMSDLSQNDAGEYVANIRDNVTVVRLATDVIEQLQGSALIINTSSSQIRIPAAMIDQIKPPAAAAETGSGEWKITLTGLEEQQLQAVLNQADNSTSIAMVGDGLHLDMSYISRTKKENRWNEFTEPITIQLTMTDGIDVLLSGIYQLMPNGAYRYLPTTVNGNKMSAEITEPGKYIIMTIDKHFTDTVGHWAERVIKQLAAWQIINGDTASTFAPERAISRAEFAALIARSLQLEENGNQSFADIANTAWYAAEVAAVHAAGIVTGTGNNRFNPSAMISREEMAIILVRAYEWKHGKLSTTGQSLASLADESSVSTWAKEAVAAAIANNLLQGRGNGIFAPTASVTRAEATQALANLLRQR